MKFNFKKIAPILASAVLLGSTIGFASVAADLGSYPTPFVQGGSADVTVVYGSDGMAIDMEAAALFSGDLASELASQTADGGGSITTTGESVDLSLSSRKIYFREAMNTARTSVSKEHLPNLLADGTVVDKSGISYKYSQSVTISSKSSTYGKSSQTLEPMLYFDVGTGSSNGFYNYTVTLHKALNVSSSDVYGYATFSLQGKDFLVGPSSDEDTLNLYGAGVVLDGLPKGEERTITLDGVEHTILVSTVVSTPKAVVEVDGVSLTLSSSTAYTYPGDIVVYVKDIYYVGVAGETSSVDLVIGSNKLTLENGQEITYLKDGVTTTMTNTIGTIVSGGSSTGKITGFTVGQAGATSTEDYLKVGESYTDSVFGGLKLDFSSLSPALDSENRETIVIETDNCKSASMKFTPDYAGSEYTLTYAMDQDQSCSATNFAPILAEENNETIHVVENATIDIGELVVVNAEDEGQIWKLISAGQGTSTSDYTLFRDVISGEEYKFETGTDNYSDMFVGSGHYYVKVEGPAGSLKGGEDANVTVNWGSSSTYSSPGSSTTVFPRIKLKSGGWLAILSNVTICNTSIRCTGGHVTEAEMMKDYVSASGPVYSLPGQQLLSTYQTGDTFNTTDLAAGYWTQGNITYTLKNSTTELGGNNVTAQIVGVSTAADSTAECGFTKALGPAVLIVEEKQVGLGETNGNAICTPLTTWAKSGVNVPAIDEPDFTDVSSHSESWYSKLSPNSQITEKVDKYGTFVSYDKTSDTGYKVTVRYPEDHMVVNVLLGDISAAATTTEPSEVEKLGDVVLSDVEAESSKPLTNLIVVGDSCVNRVALKLVSAEAYEKYKFCGAKLTELYGYSEDQAIVKLFDSPYSATKKAMLVAGWEGADTVAAAKQVIDKKSQLSGLDDKIIKKGVDYT